MHDGIHIYYTIQARVTATSPWLKKNPIKPIKKKGEWGFSSFDSFGLSMCPHIGAGNSWRPKNQKADDECGGVWSMTSSRGWWTLKYAVQALKRLRIDDFKGMYDTCDEYRKGHQSVRHEFRIVRMTVSQKMEII